jgi:hypothetical protein
VATVTAASVATWARFTAPPAESDELELLELVIDAALEHLDRDYVIADTADLTATEALAVTMQVARLWKRRDTPEGRAAFGGEVAVLVTRFDDDVHAMLVPKVGIA